VTALNVVKLPVGDVQDIPRGLRELADDIENGKFDDAHLLAWVIDCGNSRVEIGMLGKSPEPGAVAYHLYGMAKRKLEDV